MTERPSGALAAAPSAIRDIYMPFAVFSRSRFACAQSSLRILAPCLDLAIAAPAQNCSAMSTGIGASLERLRPISRPIVSGTKTSPPPRSTPTPTPSSISSARQRPAASRLRLRPLPGPVHRHSVHRRERLAPGQNHLHGLWRRERSRPDADSRERSHRRLSQARQRRPPRAGTRSRQLLALRTLQFSRSEERKLERRLRRSLGSAAPTRTRPYTWTSADAAGLPIFPGLARYDEVAAGAINHALRFTLQYSQAAFTPPASHWAANSTNPYAAPMGMRMRLKSSFNISGFPPQSKVILRALQQYGMIMADNGSSIYISGAPDDRWDNDDLGALKSVPASAFEVSADQSALHRRTTFRRGRTRRSRASLPIRKTVSTGSPVTLSWNVSNARSTTSSRHR